MPSSATRKFGWNAAGTELSFPTNVSFLVSPTKIAVFEILLIL